MQLSDLRNITGDYAQTGSMPAMFIGHGNPMNGISDNAFTRALGQMGASLPHLPNAILVISAHWLTKGTHVLVASHPPTIHDFGGFPEALYAVQYPAPGAPELARETKQLITSTQVQEDDRWGLDHGAWTILKHMYPQANIPVFQLSIDYHQPPEYHYKLAAELKVLRNKGVLIIGSGNIVHNLRQISFSDNAAPYDWALSFDATVKQKLEQKAFTDLVNYHTLGRDAQLSIPTNDHYLPMLYTLGLVNKAEEIQFTYEEIQNGSISMRCFQTAS
ncbi:4,5-DOPA dioxygenase extradiol [Chitinophaga nivalis]|uniref:4,5-DOPA dioxygenase extradiol n=1 Tax=Chitinophaga nivalis TaxID=2991709 RepID=A0ABT3IPP4_9BACT|nr:4,5-DOPA dioxygenase extradiol [Chitinophaga nivalis]MCW3464370.1 4,5-DOPA dioxygenase extradiol [Chitinophaga nivalis]MCW3485939.1 4,5-DOPA dioxygenase extradiol [Chitinophaga nivalis]